ncbi:right-handed parallel beta-helix repeat-containing protein [Glycomyces artemisiae]|nr:right-handed parallel beta-helix repeat-containing protein [Glycomyces artemisiae]
MSPAPRPHRSDRRLAALAFMTGVLAVLVFTCYVGGTATESRLAEPDPFPAVPEPDAPAYREDGPLLLVCTDDAEDFAERNEGVAYSERIANERLQEDCLADGYRDLPAAIAAAEPDARIQILPGHYTVDATIVVETAGLQIEGVGDSPDDVQVSAHFAADAVLTAHAASGLYIKGVAFGQARGAALRLTAVESAMLDEVGAFQSDGAGLHVADSSGVEVRDCRAEAADTAGVLIENSSAHVIGCEATGNAAGIEIRGTDTTASAVGNRLHGNTTGLVIADSGPAAEIDVSDNVVYGNNADHYSLLGTAACEADAAQRDWTGGVLCPDRTYPVGVGVLVANGTGTAVAENRIWNQQTAGVAAWGRPGQEAGLGGDRNTFSGNVYGFREDGAKHRNRLDVWWDGTGAATCFDESGTHRTTPSVLPACGGDVARIAGDPLRTLKVWECGLGDSGDLSATCDWLGARFTDRLEFQTAVAFAAVLLFLAGAGWLGAARSPNPPRAGAMTFSAIATGCGALLFVLAVWSGRADYEALAVALWGGGWLLAGRSWFRSGVRFLGGFTVIVGGIAVLDAIDRGVVTLAPMPVSPAWLWLGLLPLWTLFALGAAFGPRRRAEEPVQVERTPVTAPVNDRWDW